MQEFSKSILNYFATFNETRFRFNRKLPYEWTDDSLTLDLSVFPEFQRELLVAITSGTPFRLKVGKNQYAVRLDGDRIREQMGKVFAEDFNENCLEAEIASAKDRLEEALPDADPEDIDARALKDGIRQYNLALRDEFERLLIEGQAELIAELRSKLGFRIAPPSSFNTQREVQKVYDELQNLARAAGEYRKYIEAVDSLINELDYRYVIFDLHLSLRTFLQFVGTQSVHVFFHQITLDDQSKYPLFSVEVNGSDDGAHVLIESVRDVVMLNTPAVNSFEFDTILTTPRAARFNECDVHFSVLERFLQAKYQVSENILQTQHFAPLLRDKLPSVHYRVGLQAVKDEDRKILDYSELITTLETGGGHKFVELVSRYVGGNVENTGTEVDQQYNERYPRRSAERLVPSHSTIPLALNEAQRRILTAIENPKNEIIVVDGPPGTGKSYTITAMVYLANQLGKSMVVTSHKKQALDVIDEALTTQFKKLHPQAKPPVLRLDKSGSSNSINDIQNTLSSQVVNVARARSRDFKREAVEIDRGRVQSAVAEENDAFWQHAVDYKKHLDLILDWTKHLEALRGDLGQEDEWLPQCVDSIQLIDVDRLQHLCTLSGLRDLRTSVDKLHEIYKKRDQVPGILAQCEEMNRLSSTVSMDMLNRVQSNPPCFSAYLEIIQRLLQALEPDSQWHTAGGFEAAAVTPLSGHFADVRWSTAELKAITKQVADYAEMEKRFLGKLLKRKDLSSLRERISGQCPEVGQILDERSVDEVHTSLQDIINHVDGLKQQYPFLRQDYILQGCVDYTPDDFKKDIDALSSLEFASMTAAILELTGKQPDDMTISELEDASCQIQMLMKYREAAAVVGDFADLLGVEKSDIAKLYQSVKHVRDAVQFLSSEDFSTLHGLFDCCGTLLEALDVSSADLSSLFRLADDANRREHLLGLIKTQQILSRLPKARPPARSAINEYLETTQKLSDRQADERFSRLLDHAADVARIQTAIGAGRRISLDQARVLLDTLSCIIAEPGMLSRHFPMEPDMIDLLVIDEASQVSIAESISLMLRAKQTIVFGDELQYGAVGAVNVSQRYAEQYFKDILASYAKEQRITISPEDQSAIAKEASTDPSEEDEESSRYTPVEPGTREWLKTFSVRTSTLAFAKALQNYSASLSVHFRSFPEIISYSNDVFYRPSQVELITNRIRTKPIGEVLRFLPVETQGLAGRNINLDEIDAIQRDIEDVVGNGYKGSIGIICSFKEQAARMEELLRKNLAIYPDLVRDHRFKVWFVGDVQGEERDLIYYSLVQDKKLDNGDLRMIYPTVGGTADNIRRLKMQRLNVGFSRAKDIMVFVHSMPIEEYSDTRLGDALRHYAAERDAAHDHYVEDESIFDSPQEKKLYSLLTQTPYFREHRDRLRLIAQFEIGKYIQREFRRNIPNYRVDFLLTLTDGGKEKSLVIEYDGLEYHTKNPDIVTAHNFSQEYLEYDAERQLELESYGYSFLRINKFTLLPTVDQPTPVAVLDRLLRRALSA